MHTMVKSTTDPGKFEVIYETRSGPHRRMALLTNPLDAAALTSYLNGGDSEPDVTAKGWKEFEEGWE